MVNRIEELHSNDHGNKKFLNKSNSFLKFKKRTFDNRLSSFYSKEAKYIYVPHAQVKANENDILR